MCILHNLLIEHPVPPDWFNNIIVELEQEDQLNQSIEDRTLDARHNQVFAYMLEGRWDKLTSAVMIPAYKKCHNSNLRKEKLLSHQAGKGLDQE